MINDRYTLIVEVGKGIAAIRCHACDKASYNLHDIEQRYCGFCNTFHHDAEFKEEILKLTTRRCAHE